MISGVRGLVDQDRVDLVDDRVVVTPLGLLRFGGGHVVAEVVETELVVRAVRDVAGVLGALVLVVVVVRQDQPDRQAHEVVHPAHPLGMEAGEVVVHRDDVDALAGQRVQVDRQGRHEGLALAGLHLGHPTEMQRRATHQLHVEVPLADGALRGLADHGERFEQDVVELRTVVEPLVEVSRLGL